MFQGYHRDVAARKARVYAHQQSAIAILNSTSVIVRRARVQTLSKYVTTSYSNFADGNVYLVEHQL
jgi:hypothetical protein